MSTVEQAEALLAQMTRGEKAQLLQRVARDLGDAYPGIDLTEGVAGQSMTDPAVLKLASDDSRAVLTLNRRDFVRLHRASSDGRSRQHLALA
jgi:hypothetical protein